MSYQIGQVTDTYLNERILQLSSSGQPCYYNADITDYLTVANFWQKIGTSDFSIVGALAPLSSSGEVSLSFNSANTEFVVRYTSGVWRMQFGPNVIDFPGGRKIAVGTPAIVACVVDRDGLAKLYINGKKESEVSVSAQSAYNLAGGLLAFRSNQPNLCYSMDVFNRVLTQDEVLYLSAQRPVSFQDYGATGVDQTSGNLVVGKKYRIRSFASGDDFTNVGAASNATGVEFVATGTTPTTWTNSSSLVMLGNILHAVSDGASVAAWADSSAAATPMIPVGSVLIFPRSLSADKFVSLTNLPTSASGLATGRVWNDAGTLKIVT